MGPLHNFYEKTAGCTLFKGVTIIGILSNKDVGFWHCVTLFRY